MVKYGLRKYANCSIDCIDVQFSNSTTDISYKSSNITLSFPSFYFFFFEKYIKMTEIEIEIELDRKVSWKRKKEIEELVKQTIGKRVKIEEMRWIRKEI